MRQVSCLSDGFSALNGHSDRRRARRLGKPDSPFFNFPERGGGGRKAEALGRLKKGLTQAAKRCMLRSMNPAKSAVITARSFFNKHAGWLKDFCRRLKPAGALLALLLTFSASLPAFGNFYEDLGVERDVSPEDLKWSYRRMAAAFHPDRYPSGSEEQRKAAEKFKELKKIYDILLDPEMREKYDAWLDSGGYEEAMRREEEEKWRKAAETEREEGQKRAAEEHRRAREEEERKRRERQKAAEEKQEREKLGSTHLHQPLLNDIDEYEAARMVSVILKSEPDLDINAQNSLGKTALHLAAEKKFGLAARILLENGADPNISDSQGLFPIHYIMLGSRSPRGVWVPNIIGYFLTSGAANFSRRDSQGRTALQITVEKAKKTETAGWIGVARRIMKFKGSAYLSKRERDHIASIFIELGDETALQLLQKSSKGPALPHAARAAAVFFQSRAAKLGAFGFLTALSAYGAAFFGDQAWNDSYKGLGGFAELTFDTFMAMGMTAAASWGCYRSFKPEKWQQKGARLYDRHPWTGEWKKNTVYSRIDRWLPQ